MSGKLFIMAGLAVVFGATSYVAGTQYLETQTQARLTEFEKNQKPVQQVELAKVVVAARELKFGEEIDQEALKVVDWPKDAFPEGAFAAISDVVQSGDRRVITPMQSGEPILMAKVTGENSRAGLAGIIAHGKRAVTIPVDTVNGVGGFVQPGDRVDLVWTQNAGNEGVPDASVMMENVKVLSVDQEAKNRSGQARVASSVTLETDTKGAEKIARALNVGRISLLLRGAGDANLLSEQIEAPVEQPQPEEADGLAEFLGAAPPPTRGIRVVEGRSVTNFTVVVEQDENPNKNNN